MAKRNATAETETPVETEAAADTGKRVITIQNQTFTVLNKYAEGHVLTANEAGALNQTRAENLRNNFASQIRDYVEEKGKAAGLEKPSDYELTSEDLDTLREQFESYADSYEFGQRVGRLSDPIDVEAKAIATAWIDTALRREGIAKKDYKDSGKYDAKLAELMANEKIRAKAARNVEERAAELRSLGSL